MGKDIRMLCVGVTETDNPHLFRTSGLVEGAIKDPNGRAGELRGWRGEVIQEDFLDEGEFMLHPGTVLWRKPF